VKFTCLSEILPVFRAGCRPARLVAGRFGGEIVCQFHTATVCMTGGRMIFGFIDNREDKGQRLM
jgi:hypothetical protein